MDGAIELKISGGRDAVDNIKAWIESILAAEAAPVAEAVPPDHLESEHGGVAHDAPGMSDTPNIPVAPP